MTDQGISVAFVVPVNDDTVYQENFLSSPLFVANPHIKISPQRGYSSASVAYNDALENALLYLERHDNHWEVLGCFGIAKN